MDKRQYFLAGALLLLLPAFLAAQTTADEIEMLLDSSAITWAQAARFILEASDTSVISDPQEAFNYAAQRNWLPKKASIEQDARLDGIALLLMNSFDLKGGIWYSLTKSAHSAYRELVYHGVIMGRVDPTMAVNGDNFLYIVNRVLSLRDEGMLAAEFAGMGN